MEAKKAFDALNGRPIPKAAQLSKEYGALLEQKQKEYEQFKQKRQEMIDFQTAKQNVDRILGIQQEEQARQRYEQRKEQERLQQNQEH